MSTITITPPAASAPLFPDISEADYAGWAEQAKHLSTESMLCDADDVILAAHLLSMGEHVLANESLRTSAMRRLFDKANPVGLRSLVLLAKMLRRLCPEATGDDLARAGLDLTTTLSTVLVTVAPDRKAFKHPKG